MGTMLLCGSSALAQDAAKELPLKWVRQTVRAHMDAQSIDAVSIGIVRGEKLVFAEGFGTRRDGDGRVVDELSIYQIASISKTFTGIVANELILAGDLDPETSISAYFGDVLEPAAMRRLADVRVKHLLTHTSGIPNRHALIYADYERQRSAGYTEEQLIRDLNSVRLERAPGATFVYSNTGYAVLGYLCEVVSGKSYQRLVRELITDKYGMVDTTDRVAPRQVLRLVASGYSRAAMHRPWQIDFGMGIPASGVISNVLDLSRLMIAQLRAFRAAAKNGDGGPLVLTGSFAEAGPARRYAYGIFEHVEDAGTSYEHSGSVDGFQLAYDFCPEQDFGMILLTASRDGRAVNEMKQELFAKLVGGSYEAEERKKSFATHVLNEVRTNGVQSGIEMLRGAASAEDFYLSEGEVVQIMLGLIQNDEADAASELYAVHQEIFPATRRPLAVGLTLTVVDQGVDAAKESLEEFADSDDYVLREVDLNLAGYSLLGAGKLDEATALFRMNVQEFPGSPNVYDSLGDALQRAGDAAGARVQYETTLALEPTSKTGSVALAAMDAEEQVSEEGAQDASGDAATQAIRRTLNDYIDGSTDGQPARLRRAFHPDLNLYSIKNGEVSVWSGVDYIADTKEGVPTGEVGSILSIDYENDIAVAKVSISTPGRPRGYIDYFMLLKVGDRWQIVHKMFTRQVR